LKLLLLPPTLELLTIITIFKSPSTGIASPKNTEDYIRPRELIGRKVFIKSLIIEFLIKGLLRDKSGVLKLLEKGSINKEQINIINKAKA
jgi:hypothetical protein